MDNKIYKELYEKIKESNYIVLLTHKNPDPDTIGSALALSSYLKTKQKKHKVFNVSKNSLPQKLEFLEGFSKIVEQLPTNYDLVIYLDCSNEFMVGRPIDKNVFSIVIDHHQTSSKDANISFIDPNSGSTGELVFDFFSYNNIKITKEIATALYVSIYEDTVGFSTPRTTANTFNKIAKLVNTGIDVAIISNKLKRSDSLAKYRALPKILDTLELYNEGKIATIYCEDIWLEQSGAKSSELDFVSNLVLNIAIVKVVIYFRKVDNKIRVSLRGKGELNLSKIAQNFNGGGHKNAAGFIMDEKSIKKAKDEVLNFLKNHIFD